MKIKDISSFDRPRNRIKKKGVSNLSNVEPLAAVIGSGYGNENALDLSHRIISKYNFNKMNDLIIMIKGNKLLKNLDILIPFINFKNI